MRPILAFLLFFFPLLALAGSPGKPGAGLTLQSPALYSVQPGQVKRLELVIAPGEPAGQLTVTLKSDSPSLELLSQREFSFDLADTPRPVVPVEVLAHQAGRHYLMLSARLTTTDQVTRGQSLGVVIQAGTEAAAQRKEKASPSIISLPAEETIKEP